MDSTRFDSLTQTLGSHLDRRTAVRGLAAGALAAVLGGTALSADAKRRRKRRKKKNQTGAQEQPGSGNGTGTGGGGQNGTGGGGQNGGGSGGGGGSQTLSPGDFCQYHQQCPHTYICEVPVNAGNSDKTCCGAHYAPCGKPNHDGDDTHPFCCYGYYCDYTHGDYHGYCKPLPEEP